jgi:thioredoxin reductase/2-polyprenyl-3-methyl-5-hydroxy-6-metoxy-1,4-benzoquinol methylase
MPIPSLATTQSRCCRFSKLSREICYQDIRMGEEVRDMNNKNVKYDTVIVGGGAAGLSAAVTLGRARRSVLVIDAGHPRNAPAAGVHGFLTRDELPPLELVRIGREEARKYGAEFRDGTVVSARGSVGDFTVTLADGSEASARRLLIATGLVDGLPDLPGVRERWGRDVLHCPYCHGWEVRDRAIGVLATSPRAVHQALLFRQWSDNITLFLHTGPWPTEEEWEQLAARNIAVVEGTVGSLNVVDDALRGLSLDTGRQFELDALVVGPSLAGRTDLVEQLGALATDHPAGMGTYVEPGVMGATSVPGVWVAGNVSDLSAQVVVAAADGLKAGAAINADLINEEVRDAVAARQPFSAEAERANAERVGGHHRHGIASEGEAPDEEMAQIKTAADATDAAHATVVTGPFDEAFWNAHYAASPSIWSGNPNPRLVSETSGLPAGRALDIGSGEGADAIWLASRGWTVTGVDISQVALGRAASRAREVNVALADRIEWEQQDITKWAPRPASYDLVSAQFMHLALDERTVLFRDLAMAVAPGGTLLIVGHDVSDVATGHRWDIPGMFYTAQEIADTLDPRDWDVVMSESQPREVPSHRAPGASHDGGAGSDGNVTVHDVVVRAVRRS